MRDDDEPTEGVPAGTLKRIRRMAVETVDLDDALSDPPDPPPRRPTYQPLGTIGMGGMGIVRLVRDLRLRRHVAQKVLLPVHENDPTARRRFLTEAQLTAQLEHPNIVPIYGMSRGEDGVLGYSMKVVQGETLYALMERSFAARRLPGRVRPELQLSALLEHFLKVCDAVGYAHSKGVVHRDLKPENIMIGDPGEVYVLDWGLARTRDATDDLDLEPAELTRVGRVVGTPIYMSPEQARGETVTAASDQYSLGLLLYELVTGTSGRPQTLDPVQLVRIAADGTLPAIGPISKYEPLHPALVPVIRRATARDPTQRYASVAAFAAAVREAWTTPIAEARSTGRLQRWVLRNAGLAVYALAALAALLAISVAGTVTLGAIGVELYSSAAAAREARLTELFGVVDARASALDRTFASLEGQVEAVAAAAGTRLSAPATAPGPFPFPEAFFDPERRPADTVDSTSYDRPISPTTPDVVLGVDVDLADVRTEVAQLWDTRTTLRRAHLQTRMEIEGVDAATAEQRWIDEPGPIRWVIVATRTGIYLEMPGAGWRPEGFEPRARPWYTVGEGAEAPRWGRPFQEASSGTLLIPCSLEIVDGDGRTRGVASLSISFDYLISRFLELEHPAVLETFLVDAEGRVMIRSSEVGRRGRTTGLDEHWKTPTFPVAELIPQLGEGGVLSVDDGSLLFHTPLSSSGWSYVVQVDASALD